MALARQVNQSITDGHKRNGVTRVADVFTAFSTADTTLVSYTGPAHEQPAPAGAAQRRADLPVHLDVRPQPVGPNIHANATGYGVIARTFKPLV